MKRPDFTALRRAASAFWLFPALAGLLGTDQAAWSAAPRVVAQWGRFEHAFKSTVSYENPFQDVTLHVTFTSPQGQTAKAYGFWDGGPTWRVRFAPDQPGTWKFQTACSDVANRGLHGQTGDFICTAASRQTRFGQHGRVRVARDRRHLEHADGTPFFWLADTAWTGAVASAPADWDLYARVRAGQKFTAVQWVVFPGKDPHQAGALDDQNRRRINLDFFRRLDEKAAALERAGLLNAIVPLWEMEPLKDTEPPALEEAQATALVRYVVARYDAYPTAWLIAFDAGSLGEHIARWQRIGRAVFGDITHAPVILFPGSAVWAFDEFRTEPWVDGFGYQVGPDLSEETLKWFFAGPLVTEWRKTPVRPLLNLAPPCEKSVPAQTGDVLGSDWVRRALFWSLLTAPTAGISYCGQGIWDWTLGAEFHAPRVPGVPAPYPSLFHPVAQETASLAALFHSLEFWRLRPAPELLGQQPGQQAPRRFVAAARTEENDLAVVYVPEESSIDLRIAALPHAPQVTWLNPRTSTRHPAVAAVMDGTCRFPTPEAGDWLLIIKAGQ